MSRHSFKRLITLVLATLSIAFCGQALNNPPRPIRKFQSNSGKLRSQLAPKEYPSLRMTPALKIVATFLIGVASATVFWNSNSQFQTVDDIPAQYFKEKKSISCQVKRVTDGDTFRYSQCQLKVALSERYLKLKPNFLHISSANSLYLQRRTGNRLLTVFSTISK